MKTKVYTKDSFQKSEWRGGSTTELYISPQNCEYLNLDFNIRISSAIVENDNSEFTSLPGINRAIMPLSGSMELKHINQYDIKLKPFEVDYFKGDWRTLSQGSCTDFNVMTQNGIKTELSPFFIKNKQGIIPVKANYKTMYLYAYSHDVILMDNEKNHHLNQGELMKINVITVPHIYCYTNDRATLIIVYSSEN